MPAERVTERRMEVLRAIADYQQEHHRAPTYRELADALDLSSVFGVWQHVEALREAGLVEGREETPHVRAIRVTDEGLAALGWVRLGDVRLPPDSEAARLWNRIATAKAAEGGK